MDKSCGWTDAIHYSGGSALQHRLKSKWAHYKWYRSGMCPEDHNSRQWRRNKWTLVWCEGNFSLNGDLMTNKIISDLAKMISDGFSLNSSSQLLAWQKRVLHKSWFYQDEIPTDEGRWETTVTVNTDKYPGPSAWKQHTSLRFPMFRREGSKRGDVSWTDTKLWHNYLYCWERTWIVKFHLGQAELCKLVSVFSSLKKTKPSTSSMLDLPALCQWMLSLNTCQQSENQRATESPSLEEPINIIESNHQPDPNSALHLSRCYWSMNTHSKWHNSLAMPISFERADGRAFPTAGKPPGLTPWPADQLSAWAQPGSMTFCQVQQKWHHQAHSLRSDPPPPQLCGSLKSSTSGPFMRSNS